MVDRSDNPRRLGKRELGPHAFEQRMPSRIAALINGETSQNKLNGVVPMLAGLLERDHRIETAYLCDDDTTQIYKLPGEGNHFCGYRNIQMMLQEQHTIPELQDMIEEAWDKGYNSHGRIETGGIKNTRKHIGTSEAQALLQSLNVPCSAKILAGKKAWQELLDAIEVYFATCCHSTSNARVLRTELPPIFLQRPQHSITVVGLERLQNGKRRLLSFDPGYRPPPALRKASDANHSRASAWLILWRYRKNEAYFRRYRSFEILFLDKIP